MKNARMLPQINLRVPPDLKAWLVQVATKNNRSLTGEIVTRLQQQKQQEQKND